MILVTVSGDPLGNSGSQGVATKIYNGSGIRVQEIGGIGKVFLACVDDPERTHPVDNSKLNSGFGQSGVEVHRSGRYQHLEWNVTASQ